MATYRNAMKTRYRKINGKDKIVLPFTILYFLGIYEFKMVDTIHYTVHCIKGCTCKH